MLSFVYRMAIEDPTVVALTGTALPFNRVAHNVYKKEGIGQLDKQRHYHAVYPPNRPRL